jgi:MoxR-like ATPase
MSFRIPELDNIEVRADRDRRPVLVLSSNSEKNLPDAFLRRCIYYNIPFPDKARLAEIIQARLGGFKDGVSPLLDSALDLFLEIRRQNLRKLPSTAELLNWLQTLVQRGAALDRPVRASAEPLRGSLSTLAKTREDADELADFIKRTAGA